MFSPTLCITISMKNLSKVGPRQQEFERKEINGYKEAELNPLGFPWNTILMLCTFIFSTVGAKKPTNHFHFRFFTNSWDIVYCIFNLLS